jgi:hypothetical protein
MAKSKAVARSLVEATVSDVDALASHPQSLARTRRSPAQSAARVQRRTKCQNATNAHVSDQRQSLYLFARSSHGHTLSGQLKARSASLQRPTVEHNHTKWSLQRPTVEHNHTKWSLQRPTVEHNHTKWSLQRPTVEHNHTKWSLQRSTVEHNHTKWSLQRPTVEHNHTKWSSNCSSKVTHSSLIARCQHERAQIMNCDSHTPARTHGPS